MDIPEIKPQQNMIDKPTNQHRLMQVDSAIPCVSISCAPCFDVFARKRTLDLRRRSGQAPGPGVAATGPVPLPENWQFERKHRHWISGPVGTGA